MYILWVHLRAWEADGRVMYNESEDQEQCAFTIIQQSVKLLLASYNNTQAFELLHVRSQWGSGSLLAKRQLEISKEFACGVK